MTKKEILVDNIRGHFVHRGTKENKTWGNLSNAGAFILLSLFGDPRSSKRHEATFVPAGEIKFWCIDEYIDKSLDSLCVTI